MRVFQVLLVAFLLVGSASGETISIPLGGEISRSNAPHSGVLNFSVHSLSGEELDAWRISGLTNEDSPMLWSLTEANSASYGVNWSLLEHWATNPNEYQYRVQSSSYSHWRKPALPYEAEYVMHDLERIDFDLDLYYSVPIGSIIEFRAYAVGEGWITPEPTSLVLLLGLTGGGACAFGRGRPGAN